MGAHGTHRARWNAARHDGTESRDDAKCFGQRAPGPEKRHRLDLFGRRRAEDRLFQPGVHRSHTHVAAWRAAGAHEIGCGGSHEGRYTHGQSTLPPKRLVVSAPDPDHTEPDRWTQ